MAYCCLLIRFVVMDDMQCDQSGDKNREKYLPACSLEVGIGLNGRSERSDISVSKGG